MLIFKPLNFTQRPADGKAHFRDRNDSVGSTMAEGCSKCLERGCLSILYAIELLQLEHSTDVRQQPFSTIASLVQDNKYLQRGLQYPQYSRR